MPAASPATASVASSTACRSLAPHKGIQLRPLRTFYCPQWQLVTWRNCLVSSSLASLRAAESVAMKESICGTPPGSHM